MGHWHYTDQHRTRVTVRPPAPAPIFDRRMHHRVLWRSIRSAARRPMMPRPEGQHTKDYLADELEKAGLADMAKRAREGYYHDFLSPLDFPELTLDRDLSNAGTPEALALRKRHHEGEFDASREESEEWAQGPEGKAAIESLMRWSRRGKGKRS